jgi:hypothetical protein
MLATSLRVHQLEANRPLTDSEESLLRANFKPAFLPQIECWALCQNRSGRKKLFDFLQGEEPRKPTRAITSLSQTRPERDFVLLSPTCQINLARSFRETQTTRRNNQSRFASPGITGQGIFNEDPPLIRPRAQPEGDTIGKFIVKRLFLSSVLGHFLSVADCNLRLLQDINQWVDRRNTKEFPVDGLITHPTLSPYRAQTANYDRNHEDHMARPSIPPLPHNVTSGPHNPRSPWKTPGTAYTSFFDDNERFKQSYASPPMPPFEQSQPFCRFPPGAAPRAVPPQNPVFVEQAKEDTKYGHNYKRIFESKTIL